jgi:galactokinase
LNAALGAKVSLHVAAIDGEVMQQAVELKQKFAEVYGGAPRVFRAPGRVNLIGEHTDYNDGFVMPAAIDFSTWAAIAPRADDRLALYSENFAEQVEFALSDAQPRRHWSDYPHGVAVMVQRAGHQLRGANVLLRGEVPLGAGLSSSAAIEVATSYALLQIAGIEVDRRELAQLCQRAENEFVGTRCGIMDQFISCHGQANQALLLDCRSLEYKLLPLPAQVRLVICNTMVKHELASGEYNVRRAECEAGVRHLAQTLPDVRALRDVTMEALVQHGSELPEVILRRCRHVVSENARVLAAATALEDGDLEIFGQLMGESHRSLRDDYEVSCAELDLMVELANKITGVYGARMTGGGFGGSTINLVAAEHVAQFKEAVMTQYEQATGTKPEVYVCTAAEGAEEVG